MLLKLEQYGPLTEIWQYLEIKDIINLINSSKDIGKMCVKINRKIPAKIELSRFKGETEKEKKKILKIILKRFPNISKLRLSSNIENLTFGTSLSIISNCKSICDSLQDFEVIVVNGGLKNILKFIISASFYSQFRKTLIILK